MVFCMKQKRYYILIISLFISSLLPAQHIRELVQLANLQFERGEYTLAAREYNRALFFDSEEPDVISLQIAHCYANLGQNGLAIDFYNKAFLLSANDSLQNEALLGSAFCYLLQEQFILAINELLNMNAQATLNQKIQYHFLKGLAHYGFADDSMAYAELAHCLALGTAPDSVTILLADEFQKVFRYQQRYKPQRAYVMSGIVPGSGQLMSGALKDGLNSMLLIGGLYLIALNVARNYSFLDAAIALFPWVQRYYLGGMDKARGLANNKIEEKRYESYLKIIALSSPESYQ